MSCSTLENIRTGRLQLRHSHMLNKLAAVANCQQLNSCCTVLPSDLAKPHNGDGLAHCVTVITAHMCLNETHASLKQPCKSSGRGHAWTMQQLRSGVPTAIARSLGVHQAQLCLQRNSVILLQCSR
jgi:hypothetical protein